jgi:hypothetical protein
MDFVIVADHPPNLCPSSNEKVRRGLKESFPKLPALAKSLGVDVTFVGIPVVNHKIFMVARAPNPDVVRELIVKAGLIQTNTVHIYPTVSFEEAIKMAEVHPALF